MLKKFIIILITSILFIGCKESKVKGLITEKAMVVSAKKEASKVGSDILQKGGNAYDAMIATHFALAVVYPVAGNIGGGGFMVYRDKNGKKVNLLEALTVA